MGRVHPLRVLVGGVLLVFLDLRVEEVDLLPDLVGVAFATIALLRVRRHSRWVDLALLGMLALLPGAVVGLTSREVPAPVELLTTLGQTALVFGTCSALVAGAVDAGLRRSADRVRWIDLALTIPALGFHAFGPAEKTPVHGAGWMVLMSLAALVVLTVAAWWLLLMWRTRHDDLRPREAVAEPAA